MKLIGMIHLKALPGYPQHEGMQAIIAKALEDAVALEQGGVDAILIENTDDDPHRKVVGPETVSAYTIVAKEVKHKIKVPLGICVLWNDYKAALAIAKIVGCDFVRIPVFTEAVLTASGIIEGNPYDAITYRECIKASKVRIMADVQVKHATMLAKRPIEESAKEALHFGADEIIITGRYTGDCPNLDELRKVRESCPNATIVIGSGVTPKNISELKKYADAAIVGTYFKEGDNIIIEKVISLKSMAR